MLTFSVPMTFAKQFLTVQEVQDWFSPGSVQGLLDKRVCIIIDLDCCT